jgi:predicted glycosyl hydrolase (DUF1957 family)
MPHNGMRIIEKRRKEENAYREMEAVISANRHAYQIANFETRTTEKIEKGMKKVRIVCVFYTEFF